MWAEVLLSFSLRRNIATICDQSVGADTIPTIHGLRSISMGWVILGHTCIVAFKYSGECTSIPTTTLCDFTLYTM